MMNSYSPYGNMFGNYLTRIFTDIFPDESTFIQEYTDAGFPYPLSEQNLRTIYYLLYARYGNSHIASMDETQFKYKLFSTIFMYGPTWVKRLDVQEILRNMSEEELMTGTRALLNRSDNPSQPIFSTDNLNNTITEGTDSDTELPTINSQNVSKFRKGKLDAYMNLLALLETDVTEEFLLEFRKLFIKVIQPYAPLWFIEDSNNEGDN